MARCAEKCMKIWVQKLLKQTKLSVHNQLKVKIWKWYQRTYDQRFGAWAGATWTGLFFEARATPVSRATKNIAGSEPLLMIHNLRFIYLMVAYFEKKDIFTLRLENIQLLNLKFVNLRKKFKFLKVTSFKPFANCRLRSKCLGCPDPVFLRVWHGFRPLTRAPVQMKLSPVFFKYLVASC